MRSARLAREAPQQVTLELLDWADIVFVMERRQRNRIHKLLGARYAEKQVVCLYIRDEYEYMQPALVELLKARLARWVVKAALNGPLT